MGLFDSTFQVLVVFLAVLVFDACTKKKAIKRLRSSLFIRRFSTGSLSVYTYSYLIGIIVRFFIGYDPESILNCYAANIISYVIIFFLFIYMDKSDWMMSPDWVLSSVTKIIRGKHKAYTYANDSHLQVQPVVVFEK